MVWRPWGRFSCGTTDAEWSPSNGKVPVAGRLYFPAAPLPAAASSWLTPWRWRTPFTPAGQPWLLHSNYARGLARFLFFRLHGRLYDVLQQLFVAFVVALGKAQRLDLQPGAPLAPGAPAQLPLIVFSHGLGGHRFLYSVICAELASQGYAVLAVEHADGSASAAQLPGGTWKLYAGLGDVDAQVAKTRVRVAEMKSALAMMQALHRGERLPGLKLSDGLDAATFFKGRLDVRCVAAAGHSYGGATTAALIADDPLFHCGVTLDPWWYAVPPEAQVLRSFRTKAPLLIMGSHDWNIPNNFGQLSCGGERQEQILSAARVRQQEGGEHTGGGAMLLCIAGSSHNTFADALPLFGQQSGWLLERLGLSARLDPVLGIHLCTSAMLAFLSVHLPLSSSQREVQNWEPSKPDSKPRWDCILHHDLADSEQSRGGVMGWLFRGRGLLLSLSDTLLNHILFKPTAFHAISAGGARQGAKAPAANGTGEEEDEGPDDVLTGAEAAEAALPSANPASGAHPHAPGAATDHLPLTGATRPGGPGTVPEEMSGERRAAVREGLNMRYNDRVEEMEVEEMTALLGSQHIFKCLTV